MREWTGYEIERVQMAAVASREHAIELGESEHADHIVETTKSGAYDLALDCIRVLRRHGSATESILNELREDIADDPPEALV